MREKHLTQASSAPPRIPLVVKVLFTAFMMVLVPVYLINYGPTNFLYFCDVALIMTLVALWREDPLWASMPTVGILLPQAVWMVDFLGGVLGFDLLGMTAYMFNPNLSLFARGLSFFHFWLPLLLLWLTWRLGYDRRALAAWTVCAWILMVVCYFFMPAPPASLDNPNLPVNINFVYGPSEKKAQEWLPEKLFFGLLLVAMPLLVYTPTHLVLGKLFPRAKTTAT